MEPEKKSNGALIGVIVIILILVLGGIYIWQSKVAKAPSDTLTEEPTTEDSNELQNLEQELNTTDVEIGASVIESVQ